MITTYSTVLCGSHMAHFLHNIIINKYRRNKKVTYAVLCKEIYAIKTPSCVHDIRIRNTILVHTYPLTTISQINRIE